MLVLCRPYEVLEIRVLLDLFDRLDIRKASFSLMIRMPSAMRTVSAGAPHFDMKFFANIVSATCQGITASSFTHRFSYRVYRRTADGNFRTRTAENSTCI